MATTQKQQRQVHQQTRQPVPTKPLDSAIAEFEARKVTYRPLAEQEDITLTVSMVRYTLAAKSKAGRVPGDDDVMKFMMLCKSRQLNPFVGDAYLIGYDNADGTTSWSLITAIQSLRKRAESNKQYRGTECGIVLSTDTDGWIERAGSILLDTGERIVGGWAKVYREDRTVPHYANAKLATYTTGLSRWAKDPCGMIQKVAEAAALRQAFPSDLSGLYLREEFDDILRAPKSLEIEQWAERAINRATRTNALADKLATPPKVDEATDQPHNDQGPEHDEPVPQATPSQATNQVDVMRQRIAAATTTEALDAILKQLQEMRLDVHDDNVLSDCLARRREALTEEQGTFLK